MRNAITVKEAQSLLQNHGLVLKVVDGDYVVNYRHGSAATEVSSDCLEDAVAIGVAEAQRREAREVGRRNRSVELRAFQ